jgi:hypothetical protein
LEAKTRRARDFGGRGGRNPQTDAAPFFALDALVQADSTTSKAVYPAYTPAYTHRQRRPPARLPTRYLWAVLLARIFEVFPLRCAWCGTQMRLIAFVTDPPAVTTILAHLGEPTTPPEVARARGPRCGSRRPSR